MTSLDLDKIRAQLAGSMSSLQAAGSKEPTAPPEQDKEKIGPLGSSWTDGTRLGEEGAPRDAGTFLQENWDKAQAVPPEEAGVLGGAGQEKDGGPPDRTAKLKEIQEMMPGEWEDVSQDSALHAAYSLLFIAHQQAVNFNPEGKLNITAAGQKTMSPEQVKFAALLKALNLTQGIARDVRNLGYSRYARTKCDRKDTSQFARQLAQGVLTHATAMKEHVNGVMSEVYSKMC